MLETSVWTSKHQFKLENFLINFETSNWFRKKITVSKCTIMFPSKKVMFPRYKWFFFIQIDICKVIWIIPTWEFPSEQLRFQVYLCSELNNRISKLIMFLSCVSKSSIILFRVSFGRFWWRHYRQWPTGCFKWIAICLFMQETDWNIWDLMIDSLDLDKRRFQNSIAEFSELARSSPSAELWFDSCIGKLHHKQVLNQSDRRLFDQKYWKIMNRELKW